MAERERIEIKVAREDAFAMVAFYAYRKSAGGVTYDGKPIPSWDGLSDAVRQHWRAAAAAVGDLYSGALREIMREDAG